jgi:Nucleotide modification associated domain 1
MATTEVMSNTNQQYDEAVRSCKDIFIRKTKDYGTSWRVLRTISIVDQIFIKAQRIRTIQQKGVNRVGEDVAGEFKAIVNYGVIGLIQLQLKEIAVEDIPAEQVSAWYGEQMNMVKSVMQDKNHDYGEAWRDMSQESFVDLILMKLMRIRQILSNDGKTLISEGIDANYTDIINYAVFALILIEEGKHKG